MSLDGYGSKIRKVRRCRPAPSKTIPATRQEFFFTKLAPVQSITNIVLLDFLFNPMLFFLLFRGLYEIKKTRLVTFNTNFQLNWLDKNLQKTCHLSLTFNACQKYLTSYTTIYFFRKKFIFSNVYISVNTIFECLFMFFGWERGHQLIKQTAGRGVIAGVGGWGVSSKMCTTA